MRNNKPHYGWLICLCGVLLMFSNSGLVVNAFQVYMPYITEVNGFTDLQVSMIPLLRNLFSIFSKVLTAVYFEKLGLRRGVTLATLLIASAFVFYGLGTGSIVMYCIAAALAGLGYGLGAMIPISILIKGWFRDRSAFVLSICASGSAIATFICPIVVTWMVENVSLAASFLVEGLCVCLIALVIWLLVRNTPADKGMEPYTDSSTAAAVKAKVVGRAPAPFWNGMMLLACFMVGALGLALPSFNTLYYKEIGMSSTLIASSLTFSGVILLVGKWVYGIINDAIGPQRTNVLFTGALLAGAVTGCMLSADSVVMLFLSTALINTGLVIATVGISIWAANLSSEEGYVRTLRNYQVSYTIGGLAFSSVPGLLADLTGSYLPTRLLAIALSLIVVIGVLGAYRSSSKQN